MTFHLGDVVAWTETRLLCRDGAWGSVPTREIELRGSVVAVAPDGRVTVAEWQHPDILARRADRVWAPDTLRLVSRPERAKKEKE